MTAATVTAVPELDEGWIRAVLFEHSLDDWIDLGPDPLRRKLDGDAYAQQVAAAGDDTARRTFGRPARDCAGRAPLALAGLPAARHASLKEIRRPSAVLAV